MKAQISQLYTTCIFVFPDGRDDRGLEKIRSIVSESVPPNKGVNFRVSLVSMPAELQQVVDHLGGQGHNYVGGIFILLTMNRIECEEDARPEDALVSIAGVIAKELGLQIEFSAHRETTTA